jgi:serine/threonine protein kinase
MVGKPFNGEHDNPSMADDVIASRYRLIEPLGRGAMSSVWLAEDPELARRVAIKMLAPTADRARFEREARAAAALSHPNIASLYDYGEADGKPYMVLEYLPGGSLEDRLAAGRSLPDADTQRVAAEVAAGLAHARERGLVHRDLKPANVLFDAEGRAKIADFGIARMGDAGTLTEAGTVLGTAAYISPEQAAGLTATTASDVYSFAVILFRMLTGRLPFVADNAMELVRMHRDDPPPLVADVRSDAPQHLARIADAALAKDPGERPRDGAALLAGLAGDATALLPPSETVATRVMPRRPPPRRSSLLLPALALALVLLAGGAALALVLSNSGNSSIPPSAPPSSRLSVPSVPTTVSSSTAASTTAPTTTASTTAATTTHRVTTAKLPTFATTTRRTTTAHTTTSIAPPPSTTSTIATTTAPPPTTTDTTATTTTTAAATTTGP